MAESKLLLVIVLLVVVNSGTDGFRSRLKRYLMYNPADLSTAIGYKNHTIHDMASLVNEASSNAHGRRPSALYNVPNFPAMGNNGVQSQTGSAGSSSGNSGSGSLSTGSSSASFAGTNQWRCDSHVVAQCDVQCLDVDPKDGCPFCISGCTGTQGSGTAGQSGTGSASSSQSGSGTGSSSQSGANTGSQPFSQSGSGAQSGASTGISGTSGSGSPFGTPASSPFGGQPSSGLSQSSGSLSGSGSQISQPGGVGQQPGTLTGTNGQGSQSGGTLGQLPSGLAGTGSQGTSGTSVPTAAPSCPYYPPNCPKVYTKLQNGCLVCTLLQQLNLKPSSTQTPQVTTTSAPVTTATVMVTCAPTRCVAPCNKGIVLGPDGCPRCKCPSYA